ncbi:25S rRNA (uracil2843-N3)-methyltransferase [Paracoccidioides brasiliensis Pb18]|uniref:Uncharacterized protein n=1 Tax=Paracoccidioides brasiliensis (strain Pb18) TaxID=502780 RepID=C1GC96_PARBD|nr:25S rRNA (uracil2843-N3)-methyltransferase [Paracoccidioides brasiliensis Pb18]EEH48539.2 hypothetical protein PADG_04618 [Paracoccidioides brasiliensis Pb18]
MPPVNQRGKDRPKPKAKSSGKSKSTTKRTNNIESAKSNGKTMSKHGVAPGNTSISIAKNNETVLGVTLLPIPLQQLLLNVFQSGLLSDKASATEPLSRPLSELVQILKTHLYRRDFLSAFADANEELLKAYALRWSAGRALAYAGIFASVCEMIIQHRTTVAETITTGSHVVCIGGGAGAEIAGLAAVWRWLHDGKKSSAEDSVSLNSEEKAVSINDALDDLSLRNETQLGNDPNARQSEDDLASGNCDTPSDRQPFSELSITAVDIADWSSLVGSLNKSILSESIPASKVCPAPLVPFQSTGSRADCGFRVFFKKEDVLSLTGQELNSLLVPPGVDMNGKTGHKKLATKRNTTVLVTLMFTLNELFYTSIPKTTAFLLQLTDMLYPGTILLVVDSPGSYSTVTLGGRMDHSTESSNLDSPSSSQQESSTNQDIHKEYPEGSAITKQQRNYPMRFLLNHALLSVAGGKWECIVSDDSRWFRRDTSKLRYQVGDGIGLEDMRFQIHAYRRLMD